MKMLLTKMHCRGGSPAADYFLLCGQKKVIKENATLICHANAPVPFGCSLRSLIKPGAPNKVNGEAREGTLGYSCCALRGRFHFSRFNALTWWQISEP
jgi:hypothetical protein